jgi:hypothetical protein
MILRSLSLAVVALAAAAGPALADEPAVPAPAPEQPVATYALVVGSNLGGPGQVELHYAEDDARRVAAVLTELGGYTPDQIDVVVHPTPDALRARLDELQRKVAADLAAGRQSRVFFYYSGHARATAIDLGDAELPLAELRQRLFQTSATLTVVVLDACQSGAFSRVKGAQPAADFSFNSRQHLDASGIAVLASSSGSELSQESEVLHSSYFTHHFLTGLRGAGDANGDGQVTIDEAYQYAYHQTLLATAETAVGGQHVTFEADMKGHGDVALSYPRAATKAIDLPASLEGQTLVEDKRSKTVIAETYKAKGAPVRIAVAPGDYQVLVRHGNLMSRCEVSAGGEVELDQCATEELRASATKGGESPLVAFVHPTRVELTGFAGGERGDAYTQSLTNFGYQQNGLAPSQGLELSGLRRIDPRLWVGGQLGTVQMPEWTHSTDLMTQTLDWNVTTIAAVARAEQPWNDEGIGDHTAFYAQLVAGLGVGRAHFSGADGEMNEHTYFGPSLEAGAGLHWENHMHPGLGFSLGYAYAYAPVIKDLIGDTHATGGSRVTAGVSYSF